MAFPTNDPLARVFQQALNLASSIKRNADGFVTTSGGVSGQLVLNLFNELQNSDAALDTLASTPGLAAYAQGQMDDPTLDIAADFVTMRAALQVVLDWVATNAGGQMLMPSMDGAGVITYPTFTQTQVTGLKTALQTLSATID